MCRSLPPAASRATQVSPSSPATGTPASSPGRSTSRPPTATTSPAVFYIYTERPIYRPGQTVHWKGIVRLLENDAWALPPAGESYQVRINDTMGNLLEDKAYTVDEYGTLHGDFVLSPDAPSGYYGINSQIMYEENPVAYGSASFVVASYRKPEFEIDVKSEKPEYIQGDTVKFTVQANYFSGGPLVDAPVEWRLTASPYHSSGPTPRRIATIRSIPLTPMPPTTTRTRTPTWAWCRKARA